MMFKETRCFIARVALFLLALTAPGFALAQGESINIEKAAQILKPGGFVLLMRHSQTVPGTGDPPEFELGKCPTQRNLSDVGRAQAKALGESFRQAGIELDKVLNSQWCRCRDTAHLAFGADNSQDWPVINSFFADRSTEPTQTAALRAMAIRWADEKTTGNPQRPVNVMLVTHQVNISAALGTFTRQGEVIITRLQDGAFQIVARLSP